MFGFPTGSDGKEYACNAETQVWSLGQDDSLEKGTVTRSSILAWRIPWTEELSGLPSMVHSRVLVDTTEWITLLLFIYMLHWLHMEVKSNHKYFKYNYYI